MEKRYQALRDKIKERGMTMSSLSRLMGFTSTVVYQKARGKVMFNANDIVEIARILNIKDPAELCRIFELL